MSIKDKERSIDSHAAFIHHIVYCSTCSEYNGIEWEARLCSVGYQLWRKSSEEHHEY